MFKSIQRKVIKTNYFRKTFCIIASVMNLLIIGTVVIVKHWAIDFYSVTDAINHLFPEIIVVGTLAWIAGLILDNPKNEISVNYKDLVYEELIKSNVKITPEELESKLRTSSNDDEENSEDEDDNFAFEDADFNIGESKIEL